jgi:hypothetical protein
MTRTTPWRLITLHLSHSFFTDARTFMAIILVLNSNFSASQKSRPELLQDLSQLRVNPTQTFVNNSKTLPRVRSVTDKATLTRSPTRKRTKLARWELGR